MLRHPPFSVHSPPPACTPSTPACTFPRALPSRAFPPRAPLSPAYTTPRAPPSPGMSTPFPGMHLLLCTPLPQRAPPELQLPPPSAPPLGVHLPHMHPTVSPPFLSVYHPLGVFLPSLHPPSPACTLVCSPLLWHAYPLPQRAPPARALPWVCTTPRRHIPPPGVPPVLMARLALFWSQEAGSGSEGPRKRELSGPERSFQGPSQAQ